MQLPRGAAAARKIYVVLRIFGLGKGYDTGVNLYVDPETMKQTGQLEFSSIDTNSSPSWLVTPRWINPNRGRS